jgi:hypothetical protein
MSALPAGPTGQEGPAGPTGPAPAPPASPTPRTTVLVPLHRSQRWVETVAGTIERLHGHCAVIVSDADERDDSLNLLRDRFAQTPAVQFIGARPLAAGWVAHCNDLMARASTRYALWMPHDDEIGLDWVVQGERILEGRSDAVAACGVLRSSALSDPGLASALDPDAALGDRWRARRVAHAVALIERGDPALLGILFRSVLRRDRVPPIPERDEHGSWSDILWALQLVGRGAAVPMHAAYAKTWRHDSTVQQWTDARNDRAQLALDIDLTLGELPRSTRAVVDWVRRYGRASRGEGRS